MKKLITNYSFVAASGQVALLDYSSIVLDNLLLITNVTDNIIIYNFADPTKGGTVIGNVLTLIYNTATMSNTDRLQIFYDDGSVPLSDAQLRANDVKVTLDNETVPLFGTQGILSQFPKEGSNFDELTPVGVIDANLANVFGTRLLTNPATQSLQTEQHNAQDVVVYGNAGKSLQEQSIFVNGAPTVVIQLSGTWSGTMSFYGTADFSSWQALYGFAISVTGAAGVVTSTTTSGVFQFSTAGLRAVRVQMTSYTSGTCMVTMVASQAVLAQSRVAALMYGSQGAQLSQRATTYESNTYDTGLNPLIPLLKDALLNTDTWNPNISVGYFPGDTVIWNGQVYQCTAATGTTVANMLPTATSYWRVDPRSNKSLISQSYVSNPAMSRLRVETDMDDYVYRMEEDMAISAKLSALLQWMLVNFECPQTVGGSASYIIDEVR